MAKLRSMGINLYLVRRLLLRESSIDKQAKHDPIFLSLPSLVWPSFVLAEQKQCTFLRLVRLRSTPDVNPWWLARPLPPSPTTSGTRSESRGKAPLLSTPPVEPFQIPSFGEHRHRSVKAKDMANEAVMPSISFPVQMFCSFLEHD